MSELTNEEKKKILQDHYFADKCGTGVCRSCSQYEIARKKIRRGY